MLNFKLKIGPTMLRTLIIDDESHIRVTLARFLAKYCPQAQLVGEAASVEEGLAAIHRYHPDLVLLDIKMDDGTGFDLLNHFDNLDFRVIFITAYEKYAIEAFGYSAIDYLLKPVNPEKLAEAVGRAEQLVLRTFNTQVDTLKANLKTPDNRERRIILKTMECIYLLNVSDIIHCASEGSYTEFHTLEQGRIMVSKILKEFDELLSDAGFFRIHRSHLINLKHLMRFDKQEGGYVIMSNGDKVPASTGGRERLLELFDQLSGQ